MGLYFTFIVFKPWSLTIKLHLNVSGVIAEK